MPYCTNCGSPIPKGQGRLCSMCYGDPDHGSDGYYLEYLEAQDREAERKQQQQQEQQEEHQ